MKKLITYIKGKRKKFIAEFIISFTSSVILIKINTIYNIILSLYKNILPLNNNLFIVSVLNIISIIGMFTMLLTFYKLYKNLKSEENNSQKEINDSKKEKEYTNELELTIHKRTRM